MSLDFSFDTDTSVVPPDAGDADGDDLFTTRLAACAVDALIQEAELTPKPGLVDTRGSGAHADLDLELMHRSAHALFPCFKRMAVAASWQAPSQRLREGLAAIGRDGEAAMFEATRGVNTHKGAIWALGLLVAATAMRVRGAEPLRIAADAGRIARFLDASSPPAVTHGSRASARYGVSGARGQAQRGFPDVVRVGLPALHLARTRGVPESCARLDALLAIMAELDDTCLLHRGGETALATARRGAARILRFGGSATAPGLRALHRLDAALLDLNASPGGSGDLLAATLFLDSAPSPSTALIAGSAQHQESEPWNH
jgi:triphosphoribosyl-dephospho-CoA synthase